jgi:hypothetical protein
MIPNNIRFPSINDECSPFNTKNNTSNFSIIDNKNSQQSNNKQNQVLVRMGTKDDSFSFFQNNSLNEFHSKVFFFFFLCFICCFLLPFFY